MDSPIHGWTYVQYVGDWEDGWTKSKSKREKRNPCYRFLVEVYFSSYNMNAALPTVLFESLAVDKVSSIDRDRRGNAGDKSAMRGNDFLEAERWSGPPPPVGKGRGNSLGVLCVWSRLPYWPRLQKLALNAPPGCGIEENG